MVRPSNKKNFKTVREVTTGQVGDVQSHLSSQFTVVWRYDNKLEFLFYKDKGVTWYE